MAFYLSDIPLDQAKAALRELFVELAMAQPLGEEKAALSTQLVGRVTSRGVTALRSSPHYHAAAMDGFAIRAEDTFAASERAPVVLPLGSQAAYVDTGDPLPESYNAVIPIEMTEALDRSGALALEYRAPVSIRIRQPSTPWQHVRPMGEDIIATELVLPPGHTLTPPDLGALAASGNTEVWLWRKPRIVIVPTGSELVPWQTAPESGEILEFNSLVMSAQLESWGADVRVASIVEDDVGLLRKSISAVSENVDLVLVNAGSSAGKDDYTASAIESIGTVLVHGVAVRPGHPVIIGQIHRKASDACPVIGVPGYPVSAALTLDIFLREWLAVWGGREPTRDVVVTARLTQKVTSPPGDDDFMRVAIGQVDDQLLAAPLARGAGVITSLIRADGLAHIPAGVQGYAAGERLNVRLLRPQSAIENTIFAVGSHDISLDLMIGFLVQRARRLVSSNVGSLAGLIALRNGNAHLAGAHLLDPETGSYNLPYIREYLPDTPVTVLGFVYREQGLILPKGNPRKVKELMNLTDSEIHFVNRQRGSGTRVLLDYHLAQADIQPGRIQGYDQEEFTHLTAAAAVASGRADVALGIQAAAHALGLHFLPLFNERYDIIIPERFMGSDLMKPLLDLLHDEDFKALVAAQPGYDPAPMGKIIRE